MLTDAVSDFTTAHCERLKVISDVPKYHKSKFRALVQHRKALDSGISSGQFFIVPYRSRRVTAIASQPEQTTHPRKIKVILKLSNPHSQGRALSRLHKCQGC